MSATRLESDSIGTLAVPSDAYYGVHSLRARQNFHITGQTLHPALIVALAQIKKAAALTNQSGGFLSSEAAQAIVQACDEIIAGQWHEQFIVDPLQGGAGTSANMNANEVIANRAITLLGGQLGDYTIIHPIAKVNMSQSTNDVFPTAGKLAILTLLPETIHQLKRLHAAFNEKAQAFDTIIKMGRTQLQDAVPMRLGQSFQAFAKVIARDIHRLETAAQELTWLNLGGTAIGTAINVPAQYLHHITPTLSRITGLKLRQADDLIDATQNLDSFVAMSGALKTCAVNLSKIANDLRLLSSGPRTGIHEIELPPRQNGSSIMPGKVNPVIPEVVSQVAFHIIGHDFTITMAAEAGQLELNAFEPVLFYNLFQAIDILGRAAATFTDNCVTGITADPARCYYLLEQSVGTITALCPYIGYKKAADIAKRSLTTGIAITQLLLEDGHFTREELDRLLDPYQMTSPAPVQP